MVQWIAIHLTLSHILLLNFAQSILKKFLSLVSPKVVMPWPGQAIYSTKLWCSAIGSSPIKITITKNLTTLVNRRNSASIQINEEGSYTCRATNKYGTDERTLINGENARISFILLEKCPIRAYFLFGSAGIAFLEHGSPFLFKLDWNRSSSLGADHSCCLIL